MAHGHVAHQALPGSRLEIIEGTGHFPPVEEPGQLAEVVADFIRATQPATQAGGDAS